MDSARDSSEPVPRKKREAASGAAASSASTRRPSRAKAFRTVGASSSGARSPLLVGGLEMVAEPGNDVEAQRPEAAESEADGQAAPAEPAASSAERQARVRRSPFSGRSPAAPAALEDQAPEVKEVKLPLKHLWFQLAAAICAVLAVMVIGVAMIRFGFESCLLQGAGGLFALCAVLWFLDAVLVAEKAPFDDGKEWVGCRYAFRLALSGACTSLFVLGMVVAYIQALLFGWQSGYWTGCAMSLPGVIYVLLLVLFLMMKDSSELQEDFCNYILEGFDLRQFHDSRASALIFLLLVVLMMLTLACLVLAVWPVHLESGDLGLSIVNFLLFVAVTLGLRPMMLLLPKKLFVQRLILAILVFALLLALSTAMIVDPCSFLQKVFMPALVGNILTGDVSKLQQEAFVWLPMPTPTWPNQQGGIPNSHDRDRYYYALFFISAFIVLLIGTVVLWVPATGHISKQEVGTLGVLELHGLTWAVDLALLAICLKVMIQCAGRGQVSSTSGLDREGWVMPLALSFELMLSQSVAQCWLRPTARHSVLTFGMGCAFFACPLLGDGFDTAKNAQFGALALSDDNPVVKALGIASLAYLCLERLIILFLVEDQRVALQKTLLAIVCANPLVPEEEPQQTPSSSSCCCCSDSAEEGEDTSEADLPWPWKTCLCSMAVSTLYGQTTPQKRNAVLIREAPQVVFASTYTILQSYQTGSVNWLVVIFNILPGLGKLVLHFACRQWALKASARQVLENYIADLQAGQVARAGLWRSELTALAKMAEAKSTCPWTCLSKVASDIANRTLEDLLTKDDGASWHVDTVQEQFQAMGWMERKMDEEKWAAWHCAAREDLGKLLLLLLKGNLEERNSDGETALHVAAGSAQIEVMRILLTAGASLEVQDQDGMTPLHTAATRHYTVATFLLQAKASVDAQNDRGMTALHIAADEANLETVKVLLEANASLETLDSEGRTPLQCANKRFYPRDFGKRKKCVAFLKEASAR